MTGMIGGLFRNCIGHAVGGKLGFCKNVTVLCDRLFQSTRESRLHVSIGLENESLRWLTVGLQHSSWNAGVQLAS